MPEESKVHLRFGFVELLFALTAAEIATKFAEVYASEGKTDALPAYVHLALALILVAASWVGWSRSSAPGARRDVKSIFSVDFVILLVDVLLVICYFFVVKAVDKVGTASAEPEAFWIAIIFALYLLWDFLTKAIVVRGEKGRYSHLDLRGTFLERGWVSAACLVLALVAWYFVKGITAPLSVMAADVSLLAVVLVFRSLKEQAYRLTGVLLGVFVISLILAYIGGR